MMRNDDVQRPVRARRAPVRRGLCHAPAAERLEGRALLTAVTGFSLVNADTDRVVGPLANGAVINFAELGTRNLNVIANADSTTSSVRFGYDARDNYVTDKAAPFTIAPYNKGDYSPWTPAVGAHTLRATPYAAKTASTTYAISFTVIESTPLPAVTVRATDPAASETAPGAAADTGTYTFTRSGSTTNPLTVSFTAGGTATGGTDYAALPGTVTIPAGSTTATLTLSPTDDALYEGTSAETAVVTLASGSGYTIGSPSSATVTIADNDSASPTVTVSASDPGAAEAGPDAGAYTFSRGNAAITQDLVVRYTVGGTATNGSDYAALSGSVTIPAGSGSAALALTPIDDTVYEGTTPETVVLTLAADTAYTVGSPSSATVSIADNDPAPPAVSIAAVDADGDGFVDASEAGPRTATYRVSRTGSTAAALTVSFATGGTATEGSDYAPLGGSVTIAAGSTYADVVLTPVDDTVFEGTAGETTVLTVTTAAGGYVLGSPTAATVTIAENDSQPTQAPVVSLVSPLGGNYAGPLGYHLVRAAASDPDGRVAKVEFYVNGALLGTTTAAPYMTGWRDVSVGTYTVVARAYDDAGARTDSAPVTVSIVAPQAGRTLVVSTAGADTNPGTPDAPLRSIARAWGLAAAGDTILIGDGTYHESLKLSKSGTADKPITFKAANPGAVVIDGRDLATGTKRDHLLVPEFEGASSHIRLEGLTFRYAANPTTGNHNAAVKVGTGWRVQDCTVELVDGIGLAVFGGDVTLLRVTAQDNGCAGIGGTRVKNSLMLDCVSRRNNTGFHSGGTEGGGGKFTRVNGLLVDNYHSHDNWGAGLWFDYNNIVVTVRNSALHHNRNLMNPDGSYRHSGTGLFFEISGVVEKNGTQVDQGELTAENNLIYDNERFGVTVYSSANVTLRGNTLVNDSVELRDGRAAPFATRNLTITGNFFKNCRVTADRDTAENYQNENITIDGNTYDNTTASLMRWNGVDYATLESIRTSLGFERTGKLGTVTYTPRAV